MPEASGCAGWAAPALAAVLARVRESTDETGARFPLYADPATGSWKSTTRGSWTGGFWAGLLWLRALATGDPGDRSAAADCTRRLAYWVEQDTATRGLIFWYGTALAAGPGQDSAAAALRDEAARACLAAYDPQRGLVPWGDAFGGPRLLARADGVPGLVPLLAGPVNGGAAAAYGHLTRHLTLCQSEEPPRPAWQAGTGDTWTPHAAPPLGWSRTVPWLLLGAADGLHCLAEDGGLWEAVERLAAPRLAPGVPLVPRAREGHPPSPPVSSIPSAPSDPLNPLNPVNPLDTSAAAIEAVALLKLAALARTTGRGAMASRAADRAHRILRHLSEAHLSPRGGLLNGCYDAEHGLAPRHELIWGDYFLASGLATLTGLTDPFAA
ncbi:sugar ABC transporter permease [Streptomyces inhibens]|uniref:sugar ABC transporter permease n=1 Tax=Streptomyces inhibens TaxID=2293571 RepID=UPI001EE73994|nr:sugar ABC transporter permease [Streptomyces inhibens]UKY48284.1 sugar ABC transporter permease [Streptomyces inhibens]